MNKLIQGDFVYFDLHFIENNVTLLALFGVIFKVGSSFSDFESKAIEIAANNLPDYTVTEIIIDNYN